MRPADRADSSVVTDSSAADPGPVAPSRGLPGMTAFLIIASAVTSIVAVLTYATGDVDDGVWGAPSADEIWRGRWWGLLTSAFVHVEFAHIALNLFWVWLLGSVLEREIGPVRFGVFMVLAAIVSSAAELAATDDTGIGLSGNVYAIFGVLWVGSRAHPHFAKTVSKELVILLNGWLLLCFPLTWFDLFHVANYAHVGGLLFGMCVGLWFDPKRRSLGRLASVSCLAAAVVPLVWWPWSPIWYGARAYERHDAGELRSAERLYERSLELDPEQAWVLANLVWIALDRDDPEMPRRRIEQLRGVDPEEAAEIEASVDWALHAAWVAHNDDEYAEAERWYRTALERDGDPAWCLDGLARVQFLQDDVDGARRTYRRLLRVDEEVAAELAADLFDLR